LTEKDFIGLDKSGQRVLLLSADSDVDKLSLRISQLKWWEWWLIHLFIIVIIIVHYRSYTVIY